MAPIAKAAKSMNKTNPPRAFEFSVGHPTGLTALDVDLIKVSNHITCCGAIRTDTLGFMILLQFFYGAREETRQLPVAREERTNQHSLSITDREPPPPPAACVLVDVVAMTTLVVVVVVVHVLLFAQLTAQFTAVGGRNFLSELAKREARNEQFQFLKHTHALFSYFTRYGMPHPM